MGKSYTGDEKTQYSLQILWGQLDFFKNSSISYERYDKITCTRMLTVAGREMPLGLITTTVREYTVTQAPLDVEEAEERLKQLLQRQLRDLMDANDGIVLRSDFVTRIAGDVLTVTLLAECEEEIGRTVELPGEIGRIPAGSGS
jgi:similar to stage IV sporulation protein